MSYETLFLDAGIMDRASRERYSRRIDAVIAEEKVAAADIVGLAEHGTGGNPDLYVVHRHGVAITTERRFFSKGVEVRRVCSIAQIARLSGGREGFKGTDVTLTGYDADGKPVLRIVSGLGGPDWVEGIVTQQHQRLFTVISDAMDKLVEVPPRPSVALSPSKAGALRGWASDVVIAAGVDPRPEIVEEHATMIAAIVELYVFGRLGKSLGLGEPHEFFPGGQRPPGPHIDSFDELYGHVVARTGDAAAADRAIDAQLLTAWPS
jgi:hypothetical protein